MRAKILCVDDDPELLFINSSTLRHAGHEVFEAATGNECLSLARKENPDLILLDVMLPELLTGEIKRYYLALRINEVESDLALNICRKLQQSKTPSRD